MKTQQSRTHEEVQVGDVVECILHPAGPGTEEYRRSHGPECVLKITKIDDTPDADGGYFDGEYYIEDLEALFTWITIMDGVNDGSQVRERKIIPDIPLDCIERVVERAPLTIDAEIEDAATDFGEVVAARRFERREPGSVLAAEWAEFVSSVQVAVVQVAENALKEAQDR